MSDRDHFLICPACGTVLKVDTEPDKERVSTHKPTCPFCASGPTSHTQMIICESWSEKWDVVNAVLKLKDASQKIGEFGNRTYSLPESEEVKDATD
ncbi:hypothetical protein [Methanorbis furvi]|uniref:Uncharacterized protein n=1 Tax=Methanorbis furvi TaxID=3028299 RepID=A0AAE4SCM5_9EURY|nr:hypothetical protein [Methanocorpusculaceae archaeon Ag1]